MNKLKIVNSKYKLKYEYYINEQGNVFSSVSNKCLKTHLDKDGYVKVRLICSDDKRHTFSVHRLVMENFKPIKNMNNLQINHKDGNKLNNALSNLEWCDCVYNIHHAIKTGLRNFNGEHNPSAKLNNNDVRNILKLRSEYKMKVQDISTQYNVSKSCVESILYGRTFKQIT